VPANKKPPGRAVDRRASRAPLVLVPLASAPAPPRPPKDLLPETVQAWEMFFATPLAKQTVRIDTDLAAVQRLFRLRDERERCYRVVKSGRLVEGSQGQVVLNPLYRQMSVFDAEIRQLEDRFGLTPLARMKLGVQFGEAARSLEDLNQLAALGAAPEKKRRSAAKRRRKAT
jgi:P27 family predicted phage terminase small subunit